MASSEMWTTAQAAAERSQSGTSHPIFGSRDVVKSWMVWDALIAIGAAILATIIRFHVDLKANPEDILRKTHFPGNTLLLAILAGFVLVLVITCRRFHLYGPRLNDSFLNELIATVQACVISGLLLTGSLYILRATEVPRGIVFLTVAMVTAGVSLRRAVFRMHRYHRLERGIGTRNLLIVGTGPEAQHLRHYVETSPYCGFAFKGFIAAADECDLGSGHPNVVGNLETMFDYARQYFIDEIFITSRIDPTQMREMLYQAHDIGIDLRLIPEQFGGLTFNSSIEYIGNCPSIPLHRSDLREFEQTLKRGVDILLSALVLILLLPVMTAIAILIKLDTPGPVFYLSERLGKKGRTFTCIKFRSMVSDADARRLELTKHNERDGVLFKMANDPRITKVGRFLRKYSLDELPQFFNVLKGEMSIVGPRPPMGCEVRQYKLHHLRRLNATPGITGLWQVQARRDPSFDSYISLDLAYIENWSIWLDVKIILRTVVVVLAGTGC